jgi:hypothetical protein
MATSVAITIAAMSWGSMSPRMNVNITTATLAMTIWKRGDLLGLKVEPSLTLEAKGVYITEEIIIYNWWSHNWINFQFVLSNFASIKSDEVYPSWHNAVPYTYWARTAILVKAPFSYLSQTVASNSAHDPILHIDRARRDWIKFNTR